MENTKATKDENNIKNKGYFYVDKDKRKNINSKYKILRTLASLLLLFSSIFSFMGYISYVYTITENPNPNVKYDSIYYLNEEQNYKSLYKELPNYLLVLNRSESNIGNSNEKYNYITKIRDKNINYYVSLEGSVGKELQTRIKGLKDLTVLKLYRTKYSTWDYKKADVQDVSYMNNKDLNRRSKFLYTNTMYFIIESLVLLLINILVYLKIRSKMYDFKYELCTKEQRRVIKKEGKDLYLDYQDKKQYKRMLIYFIIQIISYIGFIISLCCS